MIRQEDISLIQRQVRQFVHNDYIKYLSSSVWIPHIDLIPQFIHGAQPHVYKSPLRREFVKKQTFNK